MRVIVFGATGMVGQGVLRECLLASDVKEVLVVTRSPTGVRHPKLRELTVADFADLSPVQDELAGSTPASTASGCRRSAWTRPRTPRSPTIFRWPPHGRWPT